MIFFNIARALLSALITVVLALSPSIARLIVPPIFNQAGTEIATVPQQSGTPSLFEAFGDIIRARLSTDERYQQAALIGALATPSPVSTASIEAALVNIFCTAQKEDGTRTVTSSGVFIDARGIILTNAHIAQFLLLTEDTEGTQAHCVIRQGSPTQPKYEVGLLYISPTWITKNAYQLSFPEPSGTGEYDFALLYVTRALEGETPETFPALAPAPALRLFDLMNVRAAGYPAEILTTEDVTTPLIPSVATTSITHLFTFGSGEIDLVAIAPSTVGQQGSSGGPIVSDDGTVVGLIVTRGNPKNEGAQSLRALTLLYIDNTLKEETGLDLAHTLAGDIQLRASVFHETLAPYLRTLLSSTR